MANWDNEIDAAARQMTVGEPDPGFKARVLARIEVETAPRRGWSLWVWPAALTAAAVLAVVTTVRLKPDTTYESKPGTTVRLKPDTTYEPKPDTKYDGSSSAAAGRSEASGAFGPGVASGFQPSLRFGEARRSAERVGGSRTEFGQVREAVASDLTPPPIEIDPIGVESMEAMESIQTPALAVARIEVPAISGE